MNIWTHNETPCFECQFESMSNKSSNRILVCSLAKEPRNMVVSLYRFKIIWLLSYTILKKKDSEQIKINGILHHIWTGYTKYITNSSNAFSKSFNRTFAGLSIVHCTTSSLWDAKSWPHRCPIIISMSNIQKSFIL